MKKLLALLLTLSLLTPAALAYAPAEKAAADKLFEQGLFYGTGEGYELDRALNRQEATALLVRLVGREAVALNGDYTATFSDVAPWATGYVGYAQRTGLAVGYDDTTFGAYDPVTPEQYLTFALRALGYSDAAGDFRWDDPWMLAIHLGLADSKAEFSAPLTRGGAALISSRALDSAMKGTDTPLTEHLSLAEQVRQDAALTPQQIYRRAANAVFYLESFEADAPDTPSGEASGFFISPDGIAVTNYHALIDTAAAEITTRDGEVYPVLSILYGSTRDDIIIMQVGKTADSGRTVQAFPYLDLADPASARVGDPVYALGAPLGLRDTFTSGVLSSLSRSTGGREYLQTTAPISSGSSGGPLLDAYGKVLGVTSASYANGQNLNLVTSVNTVRTARYSAPGKPYFDYFKGAVYHLSADRPELTLTEGETQTVVVACDYPFSPTLQFENSDFFTISAEWGDWVDDTHVALRITGVNSGDAELSVRYSDVKSDAELTIRITVLPAQEETDPPPETGETA